MKRIALTALAIGAAVSVTGCKGEQKAAANRTAAGEILPGSASDAMLPYDTVKSQAPVAAPVKEVGKAGGQSDSKQDAPKSAATATEQADDPAPADEPVVDSKQ